MDWTFVWGVGTIQRRNGSGGYDGASTDHNDQSFEITTHYPRPIQI